MCVCSDKDLERVLSAYTENSHSSTVLFSPPNRPSEPKPRLPKNGKHVLSRNSVSRVLQRQSRLSRAHSPRPASVPPPQETSSWSRTPYSVDTASPPPYNFQKYSGEISPSRRRSHSAQGGCVCEGVRGEGGRVGLPPQYPGRQGGKGEGGGRKLLKRTLSNQSLQSAESDTSGSVCRTIYGGSMITGCIPCSVWYASEYASWLHSACVLLQ